MHALRDGRRPRGRNLGSATVVDSPQAAWGELPDASRLACCICGKGVVDRRRLFGTVIGESKVKAQANAPTLQIRECKCDAGFYDADLSLTRNFLDTLPSVRCVLIPPRFHVPAKQRNTTTCRFEQFLKGRTQRIELNLNPSDTMQLGYVPGQPTGTQLRHDGAGAYR